MNHRIKICALALAGLFTWGDASAMKYDDVGLVCNDCSADDMLSMAKSSASMPNETMVPFEDYYTNVRVFDFNSGITKTFEVHYQLVKKPPHFMEYQVVRMSNPVEVGQDQQILQAFNQVMLAKANIEDIEIQIPASIAESAYELVSAGYLQNQVNDYINEEHVGLWEQLGTAIVMLIDLVPNLGNDAGDVLVEVAFEDGSIANFKLTGNSSQTGSLDFEFVGGRDVDGNFITISPVGYQSGSYSFMIGGVPAYDHFIQAASRLGVQYLPLPGGTVTIGPITVCPGESGYNIEPGQLCP